MTLDEFEVIWKKFTGNSDKLSWTWIIDGVSGGSCWYTGEECRHYGVDSEEEPSSPLDEFLEEFFPEISFLRHRKLFSLITSEKDTQNEYYGNYTEYMKKSISKDTLLNYLLDIRMVTA